MQIYHSNILSFAKDFFHLTLIYKGKNCYGGEKAMKDEITQFIEGIKKDEGIMKLDEAKIKQYVILKLLNLLGWDPYKIDEVYTECSTGNRRVDYALRHNGTNKIFIEVKKPEEDLENHQEQLLQYSFREGVRLAILTNGISWWFYLPLKEGSWKERKLYSIEIYDQQIEEIVNKFIELLSKENVISERALENAERLFESRQKKQLIEQTLPIAWRKIMS